jgi:hypothetical protein
LPEWGRWRLKAHWEGSAWQRRSLRKLPIGNPVVLVTKSFLPGFWLAFSLTYSRGNYLKFLATWKYFLAAAFLFPIGIALGFHSELIHLLSRADTDQGWGLSFGRAGKALNVVYLIAAVMVINNLETTFRSAVGTMRWRIKFLVLALAVIFAGRIYTLSQSMLYSSYDLRLTDVESGALLVGSIHPKTRNFQRMMNAERLKRW